MRFALIAAAVLVVVASNAFWIWQLAQSQKAQQQSVAQLSTQTELLTLIASGQAQKVELKAVAVEPSASGPAPLATLLCDPAGQVALLTVEHFPLAPPDKVYQLWMRLNGQPVNIGLFTVDANGAYTAVLMTPDKIANFEAAGITLEPLGGSPKPTGQAIVRGTLDYTDKN
jgi:muconolactone delta-isomerase